MSDIYTQTWLELVSENERLRSENGRLQSRLNTPELFDFIEGVKRETAHQQERWGEIADRQKSAENWFWLVGYLASKALRAHIEEDRHKALHHTISAASALANWHLFILADHSGVGIAADPDLKKLIPQEQEEES